MQDTEFPGVVARPVGEFKSTTDFQYQLLRCNVDLLKVLPFAEYFNRGVFLRFIPFHRFNIYVAI